MSSYTDYSIFSKLTFYWLNNLLELGSISSIDSKDLPSLSHEDLTDNSYLNFKNYVDVEFNRNDLDSKGPSLIYCIYQSIGTFYFYAFLIQLFAEILQFAGPLLVSALISFLTDSSQPEYLGWIYVALLFICPLIGAICRSQYSLLSWRTAIRVRSNLITSIFDKSLVLSSVSKKYISSGEVSNLLSVDVQKLTDIWLNLYQIVTAPLSITACFVLLWFQLGPSMVFFILLFHKIE